MHDRGTAYLGTPVAPPNPARGAGHVTGGTYTSSGLPVDGERGSDLVRVKMAVVDTPEMAAITGPMTGEVIDETHV